MNKKVLSILLVLSILASLFSFVSVFAANDVIYAYSFESESEGWSYYSKEAGNNSLSTAKAKEGKSSLYVNDTSTSSTGGMTGAIVKIVPGETYTATADVYNEVDGSVFILRFLGSDKKTKVKDAPMAKPTKKGEWETLTVSMAAPEGAEYVCVLVATMSATLGTAYYDNVKLMGKSGEAAAPSTPSTPSKENTKEEVKVGAQGSKYQTEINFLAKLALIDSDFNFSTQITKAEITKMIATAIHPEVDFSVAGSDAEIFADVPSTHAFYPYIKACKDLGIVKGDFENKFNPDSQITAIEAMTIVINALGYTPYAQAFGGYPTGYYSVASQTGISKGLNIASTEPITGEVAAKIIYNALFADIVQMSGITNNSIELTINNGKNILSERLGIYEFNAIVVDNGVTSVTGTSIGNEERAVIEEISTGDRITAYINGTDIAQYLGYRVKAFIRNNMEEGRYEYVYVAPAKNSVVTVNAKYIFNASNSYVEYDEDETTMGSEKLSFGDVKPRIIYNGVRSILPVKDVIPQDGFVTFIENTGDASYDLINVISFNETHSKAAWNIIVDTVDKTEGEESISCMFDPANSLDLNDEENSYAIMMNDEIKTIADIKQGDVISVAKAPEKIDGKTHYILVPSRNKVESTLESVSDNAFQLADGNEYDISSSALDSKPNFARYFELGKKITVWLDATGSIAYAKGESGSAKNYAYMVAAKAKPDANDKVCYVKIFTKEGKMEQMKLSEKCKIDGRQHASADLQAQALTTRPASVPLWNKETRKDDQMGRPVIITVNSEGLITKIDTDSPNLDMGYVDIKGIADATPVVESSFYANQHPIAYSVEDADSFETLKAGFRNQGSSAFYVNDPKSIEGKFFLTSNTLVINAAEIDTHGYDNAIYKKYSSAVNSTYGSYYQHPIDAKTVTTITQLRSLEGTDSDYSITNGSKIARSIKYDIQGYDIDPDTGVASLAVIRGMVPVAPAVTSEMAIYSRTTQVYDQAKEATVAKIYYYDKNGKEASVLYDSEILMDKVNAVIAGFAKGDIFILSKDSSGYLNGVRKIIDFDRIVSKDQCTALEVPDSESPVDISNDSSYFAYSNNTPGTGFVEKAKGGFFSMITAGPSGTKLSSFYDPATGAVGTIKPANKFIMDFTKVKPIVIDVTATDIEVSSGSVDDIITINEVTNSDGTVRINEASTVIFRQSRFVPNYLIIVNGLETRASSN